MILLGLTVTLLAACGSVRNRQPQSPSEVASLTVSLSPGSRWTASPFGTPPIGENVAPLGFATASARDLTGLLKVDAETAILAIDGNSDTVWTSNQPAPQWFSVLLDDLYRVDRIGSALTIPFLDITDRVRCRAIAGGAVYRRSAWTPLNGLFLYPDFCRMDIWELKRAADTEAATLYSVPRSRTFSEIIYRSNRMSHT